MAPSHNAVLPNAINLPSIRKLTGKRVVLASASPRRQEIFRNLLGLVPEIVPSHFAEDLPMQAYADLHEYPVATATQKAVEVYTKLVAKDPDDAPDLVIAADTIVLTLPAGSGDDAERVAPVPANWRGTVLEKPADKADQLRMLADLNGNACEVITGVAVVYPVLVSPGYEIKCMEERSVVYFVDHKPSVLKAYVDSGEGIDRAGGFAIQGGGGLLVRKVNGDYQNVVGFPATAFIMFLETLLDEEEDFLAV